ncbi:CBS domain-containing protein [Streptomyces sp. NPDC050528]|uniref:CBS domain-containing protein n=1 Tax=Streptomyces sp. NPDC050528 TaxID=3365623 RepID=UPI0037959715
MGLDATVLLIRVPAESDTAEQDTETGDAAAVTVDGETTAREPGPTVGTIVSAMGGVTSITKDNDLDRAVTLMLLNDFSQLPVMSSKRQVAGAVTWKSIAQARHRDSDCPLAEALVEAREVRYDHDLIDVLPLLAQYDFVLVRGPHNDLGGIVTVSDVALAYGSLASPFLLVGELDQRLRALVTDQFDLAEVAAAVGRNGSRAPASYSALTFGDYVNVLRNQEFWDRLGWSLDKAAFTQRLDEIRKIRNDLMHFNPDPLPDKAERQIRAVIDILRTYSN